MNRVSAVRDNQSWSAVYTSTRRQSHQVEAQRSDLPGGTLGRLVYGIVIATPFPTRYARNVEAKNRQRADDDEPGSGVDPAADIWRNHDRNRASSKIQGEFKKHAGNNDMRGSANGENDAIQRAS